MSQESGPDLRCERVRLLLSLQIDGQATSAQEGEIAAHLPGCDACRAAQAVDAEVRARCAAPAAVPPGFAERVAALAARQQMEARAQNRFLIAAAVAAVLVAGVALTAFRSPGSRFDATLRADAPRDTAGRALRAGLALHRSLEDR